MNVRPRSAESHAYLSAAELDAVSRLAQDTGAPARLRLAEITAGLLDGPLGGPERQLVSDVLLRLLSRAQDDLRQVISTRLASNSMAPRELILFLAHDDITVARPVLVDSVVLSDADLVDIVRRRSVFHGRSIALRVALSELVCEGLVGTGDIQTVAFLLRNTGAHLSPAAALSIAELARTVESLRAPLLHHPEIPVEAANALYWHVSEELQNNIRSRFQLHPLVVPGLPSASEAPRQSHIVYRNGDWVVEKPSPGR